MEKTNWAFNSIEHEAIYERLKSNLATNDSHLKDFSDGADSEAQSPLIRELQRLSVNSADRPIVEWRKEGVKRKLSIFLKKCIRKLLRWYINPVVDKQNEFNGIVVHTITEMLPTVEASRRVPEMHAEMQDMHMDMQDINTETQDIHQEIHNLQDRLNSLGKQYSNDYAHYADEIQQMKQAYALGQRQIQGAMAAGGTPLMGDFDSFQKMTYAQAGEDSIVLYMLRVLGFQDFLKITYLDLGANDPIKMNNTYALYREGARGVLVEANPDFIERLSSGRPGDIVLNKLIDIVDDRNQSFHILSGDGLSTPDYEQVQKVMETNPALEIVQTISVETITFDSIITQYLEGHAPTVLSLDVEGTDYRILESINFSVYRPAIIIIETIPYARNLTVGNKETKVHALLSANGYKEYAFTGINSIFIDCRLLTE